MTAKQSLGRGFDTLIPPDFDKAIISEDKTRIQNLLIQDVRPNPSQPRRQFDETALAELAESIKTHGIMQPIIVTRSDKGYQIVAGERRWRAAKQASLKEVPAIVRSLEELQQVELALIENIQRVDLSPLEQALAVYRLQHHFNLTVRDIAKKLGKAESTVTNISRLLQLPDAARDALASGAITEGHARSILALKGDEAKQSELLRCIQDNGWTVRQAEQFVIDTKKQKQGVKTIETQGLASGLSTKLKTEVTIKHKAKGGQIIIAFQNDGDLERITKFLQK
jgi:ParB family chromosome partitioning protein